MIARAESVLVIEDEPALRAAVARHLTRAGYDVVTAGSIARSIEAARSRPELDFVVTDVRLPDGLGFELVEHVRDRDPRPGVVVMTGEDSVDHVVRALRGGAADYLLKPFALSSLDRAMERARLRRDVRVEAPPPSPEDLEGVDEFRARFVPELLGRSPAITRALSIVERAADTDCPVLITGESGTGKELIAKAVHRASPRAEGPFVSVNCAAIPHGLLESELFGHARGAFTGAVGARKGRLAAAAGGTLFFDEIGELEPALQAKLLRVLQDRVVTPVGSDEPQAVDVRVLAATHRDLTTMVDEGTFREDLLYRLDVIPVVLPPLRERASDVPELARTFVARANERWDRRVSGISDAALSAMVSHPWPGNVRQLENVVDRMVVLRGEGEIGVGDLPPGFVARRASLDAVDPELPVGGVDLRAEVERFEAALIRQALERTGGNKKRAAALLGMKRTTLGEKLRKMEPEAER